MAVHPSGLRLKAILLVRYKSFGQRTHVPTIRSAQKSDILFSPVDDFGALFVSGLACVREINILLILLNISLRCFFIFTS